MDSMRGNDEARLDALFRAYNAACPVPEASANFMPELWRKIESRQKYTFSFRTMANAFVTAAVALTIALGAYMSIPRTNPYFSQTFVEVVSEANAPDSPIPADLPDPGR
jgi:Ser/Thr protein kinase RdoA (MazF antagonist)